MISKLLALASALLAVGCFGYQAPGEDPDGMTDLSRVSFCGTVLDDQGAPMPGQVAFEAQIFDHVDLTTITYRGNGPLNAQGTACVTLDSSRAEIWVETDTIPNRFEVKTLVAHAMGKSTFGVLTARRLGASGMPYGEGRFDGRVPDPGAPGMLTLIERLNPFRERVASAARISERPRRADGAHGDSPAPATPVANAAI